MPDSAEPSPDSNSITGSPIITQPWEDFDTILRHAERALSLADKERARTLYARLAELNPNDPRGWLGLGETAESSDEAIISWAYTLALAPNNSHARTKIDAAIVERINKSGVADAAVLLALARTVAEVGQRPSAYRLVTHATELDPTNVDAWLWRAGISDDHADTITCLKHVLSLDPENAQAKAGLEWAITQQHSAALAQKPKDATFANELFEEGQSALNSGKSAIAYTLFVKATELDPNNEAAWFWRASTAPTTEDGITSIEQTLKINPQHQAAKEALWYLRLKKYREAFPVHTIPLLALDASVTEEPATKPSRKNSSLRTVLTIAIFILLVLVVLIVAVLWRLSS